MKLITICLAAFFITPLAALEVSKVKGNKVLIQMDDKPIAPGEEYFVVNGDGKRKGLVSIKQVRDERAIGLLTKGQAEPGWTLEKRKSKIVGKNKADSTKRVSISGRPHDRAYYGIQIGYSQNKMDVTQSNGSAIAMTGGSINVRGIFDYEMFDRIWFRGGVGYLGFTVNGPSTGCNPNNSYGSACSANITYIDFDFWGRYLFSDGFYRPWIGGGFALIFPMSKTATPLDPASISNNSVISIGGGLDMFFSEKFFVPLQIEYGMLPKSDTVAASLITGRIGVGFTF